LSSRYVTLEEEYELDHANVIEAITPRKKQCFLVPFERDEKFVDRTNIMNEITQRHQTQSRVALAGIGGIG